MSKTVDLNFIAYYDATGYATHVLIELDQYLPYRCGRHSGNLRTAAFALPVRNGGAFLPCPGAEQVVRMTVQPVIAQPSGERKHLGSPFVSNAPGGVFYDWAILRTLGELIPRTIAEEAKLSTPSGNVPLPDEFSFETTLQDLKRLIQQQEVMFLFFEYRDMRVEGEFVAGAGADRVHVTVDGVKSGVNGRWSYDLKDDEADHVFKLGMNAFQDVTRIEAQPYSGKDENGKPIQYGNMVVQVPSPGMYITEMLAEALTLEGQPVNQTSYCMERAPAAVNNLFQAELTPQSRTSKKDESKTQAEEKQRQRVGP